MSQIGILYPGALGGPLGKAITAEGDIAITCLRGRSALTRERALSANFVVVPSLEEVARSCDVVVSLVPSSRALEVARNFADSAMVQHPDNAAKPIFIEANSVGVRTKKQIAEVIDAAKLSCLDGVFLGPANQISTENVMLLSGPGADRVAGIFRQVIETRVVGDEIGQASCLKMTMAILTKSLPALFMEAICASAKRNQVGIALELMRRLYPGIVAFLERTLPTYPTHIARRVFELTEVRDWLRELGQAGLMTESSVAVLERLRLQRLESSIDWRFEDLLFAIGETDALSYRAGCRSSSTEPSQVSAADTPDLSVSVGPHREV